MSSVDGSATSALAAFQAASEKAMEQNLAFQTSKLQTDTANAIANGEVDTANKALNAATQSGKAIQY
jgi:hypothetical protein